MSEPERTQYNTVNAHCMLNNYGDSHKLRICNSYCHCTVTMVTGTRVDVTFIATFLPFFLVLNMVYVQ